MITEYLVALLEGLPASPRNRRRIIAEAEDHLLCAAAELHAEGMPPEEAEREAVRRFGDPVQLARTFTEGQAAATGVRAARRSVALALLVAWLSRPGASVTSDVFPLGLVTFALFQVALVVSGFTFLRAWRARPCGGPRGSALVLVRRGVAVVVGCGVATAGCQATALLRGPSSSLDEWLVTAGVLAVAAACGASLLRSGPPSCAAKGVPGDALADIGAAAELAALRLGRRLPGLRGPLRRLIVLSRTLSLWVRRRLPRLSAWVDLRAHPWRFAVTVAGTAGLVLASARAVGEGLPSPQHLIPGLVASLALAGVEAMATLLGFAALGRFLGIRSDR